MKRLSCFLGAVLLVLSYSTFALADPISIFLPDPEDGGPVGPGPNDRYAFTWSGVLEDIETDSPFAKFEDVKFTLSGFYFTNGTFDFTGVEFVGLPDPDRGGSLVALPNPAAGGGGSLFLPNPELGGSLIALIPQIEFIDPVLGGSPMARFLSLDFDGVAVSVRTISFNATAVPEPSTILLFAAGLAGLAGVGRRYRPAKG